MMMRRAVERDAEPQIGAAPHERDLRPVPRITIQAFCESHEVAAAIEGAREDRRMARAHVKVQTGSLLAAVEYYRDGSTPNLIIVETSANRAKLLDELEQLAEVCDPGTKVVLIGQVNDVILYRELIRRGVSEYVVTPIVPIDVVEVCSALYADPNAKPLGRAVAVVGAKGGVGASSIAHNLAWTFANDFDVATVLADLDIPFGTANLDFNQDPPQGIAEAVMSPDRLDQTFIDRLLSSCTDKLSLLAAPSMLDRTVDLAEDAFEPTLDLVRSFTPWVVLDVPHVWSGWTRRTLTTADHVVIVASTDLANLRNAKNLMDTLRAARPNDTKPHLLLNQVGMPKRPEITVADFARALEVEPVGVIPFDAALFGAAANNGQMIAEMQKTAKTADVFRDVVRRIAGRAEPKRKAAGAMSLPMLDKLVGQLQALRK